MASRAIGIMLLGSVPRPPRKPRSSISTQSAMHTTVKATRAGRISLRLAAEERGAGHGQHHHDEQVDREPVRGVEGGEGAEPGRQEPGRPGCRRDGLHDEKARARIARPRSPGSRAGDGLRVAGQRRGAGGRGDEEFEGGGALTVDGRRVVD